MLVLLTAAPAGAQVTNAQRRKVATLNLELKRAGQLFANTCASNICVTVTALAPARSAKP